MPWAQTRIVRAVNTPENGRKRVFGGITWFDRFVERELCAFAPTMETLKKGGMRTFIISFSFVLCALFARITFETALRWFRDFILNQNQWRPIWVFSICFLSIGLKWIYSGKSKIAVGNYNLNWKWKKLLELKIRDVLFDEEIFQRWAEWWVAGVVRIVFVTFAKPKTRRWRGRRCGCLWRGGLLSRILWSSWFTQKALDGIANHMRIDEWAATVPAQSAFWFLRLFGTFLFVFEAVEHIFRKWHCNIGRVPQWFLSSHRLMTLFEPSGQCGCIFVGRRCAARHHLFGIV